MGFVSSFGFWDEIGGFSVLGFLLVLVFGEIGFWVWLVWWWIVENENKGLILLHCLWFG